MIFKKELNEKKKKIKRLTVEHVYRDGRLGLSGHHAAVVSGVSRTGPLHDQRADDHEDLLPG